MSVPWEVIIKEYRAELGRSDYPTIIEHAEAFLAFLGDNRVLFPDEQQELFAITSPMDHWIPIRERIKSSVQQDVLEHGEITEERTREIVDREVAAMRQLWRSGKTRDRLPKEFRKRLRARYGLLIKSAMQAVFEELPLSGKNKQDLTSIVLDGWCKENAWGHSGIVVAGFGANEMFPALVSYELDGLLLNTPIAWRQSSVAMGHETSALIKGFAQQDVFHLFMEGVDPEYEDFIEAYLDNMFDAYHTIVEQAIPEEQRTTELASLLANARQALASQLFNDLSQRRREKYVEPVLTIVQGLPKDELAALAESLVNLTSLKRRISPDSETVGGPIDVAVISRGDGLVWTKRKQYFEPDLNPQFFANYFPRSENV
jgi:hypothetical protein